MDWRVFFHSPLIAINVTIFLLLSVVASQGIDIFEYYFGNPVAKPFHVILFMVLMLVWHLVLKSIREINNFLDYEDAIMIVPGIVMLFKGVYIAGIVLLALFFLSRWLGGTLIPKIRAGFGKALNRSRLLGAAFALFGLVGFSIVFEFFENLPFAIGTLSIVVLFLLLITVFFWCLRPEPINSSRIRPYLPQLALVWIILGSAISSASYSVPFGNLAGDSGEPNIVTASARLASLTNGSISSSSSDCQEKPLYMVALTGGGIRASYWAELVMKELEKLDCFKDNLVAVSSVSGGTLGYVNYFLNKGDEAKRQAFYSRDYLAPAFAGFFFSEFRNKFFWFVTGNETWSFKNRGDLLESAWAGEWNDDSAGFFQKFSSTQARPRDNRSKKIIFVANSTDALSGGRVVQSNVLWPPKLSVIDLHRANGCQRQFSLSTAVLNSARFSYVSPAAYIRPPESESYCADGSGPGKNDLKLVDGGYFDNYGASSLLDLVRIIRYDPICRCNRPIKVFQVNNSPVFDTPDTSWFTKIWNHMPELFSELRAPIEAFLATGDAHGRRAIALLHDECVHLEEIDMEFDKREHSLPLGWTLSETSQELMKRALRRVNVDSEFKPKGINCDR